MCGRRSAVRASGRRCTTPRSTLVRDAGRTTVTASTDQQVEPPEGPGSLAATTGVGRVELDAAGSRFLLQRGFALEQVERYSVFDLPFDADLVAKHCNGIANRPGQGWGGNNRPNWDNNNRPNWDNRPGLHPDNGSNINNFINNHNNFAVGNGNRWNDWHHGYWGNGQIDHPGYWGYRVGLQSGVLERLFQ